MSIKKFWGVISDIRDLIGGTYRILPALTPELAAAAHNVRHRIWCQELGFEPAAAPEMERDNLDACSTQLALVDDRDHGIGCVRFINSPLATQKTKTLPFESLCPNLNQDILQAVKNSGHHYVEISRLGLDKNYRAGQNVKGEGGRKSQILALTLFMGVQAFAKLTNTKYLFAIVEKKLIKSFERAGIPVQVIGDPIDHHGERFPILIDNEESYRTFPAPHFRLFSRRVHRDMAQMMTAHKKGKTIQIPERTIPAHLSHTSSQIHLVH